MSGSLMSGVLAALVAVQSGWAIGPSAGSGPSRVESRDEGPQAAQSQSRAATQAPASKTPARDIRLSGCIARDKAAPGRFTLLDNESGGKYRLVGKDLKKFVGQRVEIVGGPPGKGVTFRTGLWPSPNAAAQAGALSPAQMAIATREGAASDAMPLPEFQVVTLRGVDGACE